MSKINLNDVPEPKKSKSKKKVSFFRFSFKKFKGKHNFLTVKGKKMLKKTDKPNKVLSQKDNDSLDIKELKVSNKKSRIKIQPINLNNLDETPSEYAKRRSNLVKSFVFVSIIAVFSIVCSLFMSLPTPGTERLSPGQAPEILMFTLSLIFFVIFIASYIIIRKDSNRTNLDNYSDVSIPKTKSFDYKKEKDVVSDIDVDVELKKVMKEIEMLKNM